MSIKKLIESHKKGVSIILLLILFENAAWMLEPTLFGNLIDAFIEKSKVAGINFELVFLSPLLLWVGAYLLNSLSGAYRRKFEPKVYQKMYLEIVSKIADNKSYKTEAPSKTTAHAQLSEEYITFLQYRVPEIVEQVIYIFGAIFILSFYDYRISLVCLLIAVPVVILGNLYTKKVSVLQTNLHDNYENVFEMFSVKEVEKVKKLYSVNARIKEKIARIGSFNFGITRMILLVVFLIVLYIAIQIDNFSAGEIYSIVAYLWTFVGSVEYIPNLLESHTSLKDLSLRLRTDNLVKKFSN